MESTDSSQNIQNSQSSQNSQTRRRGSRTRSRKYILQLRKKRDSLSQEQGGSRVPAVVERLPAENSAASSNSQGQRTQAATSQRRLIATRTREKLIKYQRDQRERRNRLENIQNRGEQRILNQRRRRHSQDVPATSQPVERQSQERLSNNIRQVRVRTSTETTTTTTTTREQVDENMEVDIRPPTQSPVVLQPPQQQQQQQPLVPNAVAPQQVAPNVDAVAQQEVVANAAPVGRIYGQNIARKRTWRSALTMPAAQIERLCQEPQYLGGMTERCGFCGAKFFKDEFPKQTGTYRICCNRGDIVLPPLSETPPEIRRLLTENTAAGRIFREKIRYLNNGLFAMASFITPTPQPPTDNPCFMINGQIYHYFNGVPDTQDLNEPRLNHYYFLDVDDAINKRTNFVDQVVDRELIETVERTLRRVNPFMRAYKTMAEQLREIRAARRAANEPLDVVHLGIVQNMNAKLRNFDMPQSRSEIAALFVGTEPPFNVDLHLYPKAPNQHHQIRNLNKTADPMVYPLLFPCGDYGRHLDVKDRKGKTVSCRQFYRYRIQIRQGFSNIHSGHKLFQQYLVDAWCKAEADVLHFIRQNQNRFRLAQEDALNRYQNRRRAIEAAGAQIPDDLPGNVGRPVILPTSFEGGERNLERRYQESMAMVARFGKPDLIITFTCNPNWREIRENLGPHETYHNRPDLVCRVFHAKKKVLMNQLIHEQIFGVVLAYDYVIEFQKRGLPHMHLVVTFVNDDKIRTVEDVDRIVTAEIPDAGDQPMLFELVSSNMIHDGCANDNLGNRAGCWTEGKGCRFSFPFEFREDTLINRGSNQRPLYKRPNNGRWVNRSGRIYDNTRCVPHNSYALAKYNCHINFEVVGSVKVVKYLYKYLLKGYDRMQVQVDAENQLDEVQRYLNCRYVSSTEAAWRLYEFKIHEKSHAVMLLPIHLPGFREAVIEENDNVEQIDAILQRPSKLEAFFALNARNPAARAYFYREIPEHFTWDNKTTSWNPRRVASKTIGTVYDVSPNDPQIDKFYLRVLLNHVRGPTSFEDLRTVNGELCPDFRTACNRRHLLTDGVEYADCLEEAVVRQQPGRLRRLFATICAITVQSDTVNHVQLWRRFKLDLMDDHLRRGDSYAHALNRCVQTVNLILGRIRQGITLRDLGIDLEDDDRQRIDEEGEVGGEIQPDGVLGGRDDLQDDGDRVQQVVYEVDRLNSDQKLAFVQIVNAVRFLVNVNTAGDPMAAAAGANNAATHFRPEIVAALRAGGIPDPTIFDDKPPRTNVFYLDGPGGTGKTYLYNTILTFIQNEMGKSFVSVAWTGIAANLLIGGQTAHKVFKLPLNIQPDTRCGYPVDDRRSTAIKNAALIVWDEAPMSHRAAIESIDRYLRDLMRRPDLPFGGKCVVFGGDFRQILPVVRVAGNANAEIVDACIKRWALWPTITQLALKVNMRAIFQQGNDNMTSRLKQERAFGSTYADYLLRVGEGQVPYVEFPDMPHVPRNLIELPSLITVTSLNALIDFVFGDLRHDAAAAEFDGQRAILSPTNASVEQLNQEILNRLPGVERSYFSIDTYNQEDGDEFRVTMDDLHAVKNTCLPLHELKLKKGCLVMLLKNIDVAAGQCNGTRLKVLNMGDHLIECEVLTGTSKGRVMWLPRMETIATDRNLPRPMTRLQFPLKLAFCLTINKSQGQTLAKVGVFLKTPCFSHGQLYVALSRVGSPENLRVFVEKTIAQGTLRARSKKVFTSNVIFYEIFGVCDRPVQRNMVEPIQEEDADDFQDEDFILSPNTENRLNLAEAEYWEQPRDALIQNASFTEETPLAPPAAPTPPPPPRRREPPVRLIRTPTNTPTVSDEDSSDEEVLPRGWAQVLPYYTDAELRARRARGDQAGTSRL